MSLFQGEHIRLRPLEPQDLSFLEEVENNPEFWEISHTVAPFARYTLERYLEQSTKDIYEVRQQRFVIVLQDKPLGFVDLFDFDPFHKRAGLGVLIADPEYRGKGYAKEALGLLMDYAFVQLGMHQLYANILEENKRSIALFENLGFKVVGLKKDWVFYQGSFKNELLFQKIRNS